MRKRDMDFGYLPLLKVMGVAVIASLTGACSSDVARLSDSPFANPFQGKIDPSATGAVDKPIRTMKSQALAAPQARQPLPVGPAASVATAASPVSGSVAGWSATGGTPVTASAGDTFDSLSSRYGVPVAALRAANGYSNGQPSAGQKVIIPAYNPGAPVAKVAASAPTYTPAPQPQPASSRAPRYEALPAAAPARKEAPPQAPARAERKPRYEPLAAAPQPKAKAQDDDDDTPAPKKAEVKKIEPKKAVSVASAPVKTPAPSKTATSAKAEVKKTALAAPKTQAKASVKQAAADHDQPLPPKPEKAPKVAAVTAPKAAVEKPEAKVAAKTEVKPEETTATASQEFRWPARGRVISGFGSKGPSGSNDGINIAVPEGTPVKAAETGTVAYAGEEIKGYGKMVLIRHPNGYVSAYAHNGELNVKRGDTVKRGQQIAKSGQSGNVTSPQLHFELRKGSEPVDPGKFLD